jgi:hypothetical protein
MTQGPRRVSSERQVHSISICFRPFLAQHKCGAPTRWTDFPGRSASKNISVQPAWSITRPGNPSKSPPRQMGSANPCFEPWPQSIQSVSCESRFNQNSESPGCYDQARRKDPEFSRSGTSEQRDNCNEMNRQCDTPNGKQSAISSRLGFSLTRATRVEADDSLRSK